MVAPGQSLPVIGVPVGDPAGIGPEIAVVAAVEPEVRAVARPVLVGTTSVVEAALARRRIAVDLRVIDGEPSDAPTAAAIEMIDAGGIEAAAIEPGVVQASCGRAAHTWIETATRLAVDGTFDAIATAPIHKEALRAAGIKEVGHTEILAALTATNDPLTLFQVRDLRIFFLSRHVSLAEAIRLITGERLLSAIERCHAALAQLGVSDGTLAVAGLNPHASDGGQFGDEEARVIAPAVEQARARGIDVTGPVPADSVFHLAATGRFAAVLSLFHDQGHIAAKTLDFERTVSLTLGLPFLRTSVDHGTAFDLAGSGRASARSMIEAIRAAAAYGPTYRRALAARGAGGDR